MKIIILAAGQGSRLRPLTNEVPKCMVKYQSIRLIDRLLNTINQFDFSEKVVITGYKQEVLREHLKNEKIKFFHNKHYDKTNMVSTLFCAKESMNDDTIISYSDIIYIPKVLNKLIDSKYDISIVIDIRWKELWLQRMENPLEDAETLKIDKNQIIELGKKANSYEEIQGQYIGLFKFSKKIFPKIVDVYNSLDKTELYDGKDYANMYMTSFIQKLIDLGFDVNPIYIDGGWLEIDTCDDLNSKMLGE